jgi:uncharacterized protein YgbK (DUF1537 family)
VGKLKTGLLTVTGATIGVLTLRRLRNRGSKDSIDDETVEQIEEANEDVDAAREDVEEVAEDVDKAKDEAITAVKHIGGAVKHATFAAVKAVKSRRKKAETTDHITEPTGAAVEAAESK